LSHGDNPTGKESLELLNSAGTSESQFGVGLQIRPGRELAARGTESASEGDEEYTISTVPAFTDAASAAEAGEGEE
jgi:hypothetical protein